MASDVVSLSGGRCLRKGHLLQPKESLRVTAYDECRQIVDKMRGPISKFALGPKVFLVCVDHSTKWAIPWLYTSEGSVHDRVAFTDHVYDLFHKVTTQASFPPIDAVYVKQLGIILHELFKNTHDWARVDAQGAPWRRSVRGVAIERHILGDEAGTVSSGNSVSLLEYLHSLRKSANEKKTPVIELTVFDAGIGLARSWLGSKFNQNLTASEELSACRMCLEKHSTKSASRDRGLGLAEVMRTLHSLKAFLKIRTGRLSLCRNFRTFPQENERDTALFDAATETTVATQHAEVVGTHYSILIPILA